MSIHTNSNPFLLQIVVFVSVNFCISDITNMISTETIYFCLNTLLCWFLTESMLWFFPTGSRRCKHSRRWPLTSALSQATLLPVFLTLGISSELLQHPDGWSVHISRVVTGYTGSSTSCHQQVYRTIYTAVKTPRRKLSRHTCHLCQGNSSVGEVAVV